MASDLDAFFGCPEDLGVDGDNIKMNLREIGWEGVNWIHVAQDREWRLVLVITVMNLRVP
jgi:hypothetical protein